MKHYLKPVLALLALSFHGEHHKIVVIEKEVTIKD